MLISTLRDGFYQFSPELFYYIFSEENGFKTEFIGLYTEVEKSEIYPIIDPKISGKRTEFLLPYSTHMAVFAKRISQIEPLLKAPQQSDYAIG